MPKAKILKFDASGPGLSKSEILKVCEAENVRFMRLQFTDIFGIIKNVEIPSSQFSKALDGEIQFDGDVTPAERARGKLASRWAVMTRRPAELGSLAADARWTPPRASADGRVWTDDFSSVLGVLRWR